MTEEDTKTEIDQLLVVAKHYLSMAKRLIRRNPSVPNVKIIGVTKGHILGELHVEELLLAHLASCAIRLCTVCEIRKDKSNYRNKFYDSNSRPRYCRKKGYTQAKVITEIINNLDEHIHFLLRDNVAHKQNVEFELAKDRIRVLERLTIRDTLSALDSCRGKTVRGVIC